MRLLLGVLLLLALFAAATLWQRSWTSAARAERDQARQFAGDEDLGAGWSRVIVGRPSGDQPVEPSAPSSSERSSGSSGADGAGRTESKGDPPRDPRPVKVAPPPSPQPLPSAPAAGEIRHVVKKGESLSRICEARYQSGRREIVEAVAGYNKLADPNDLREGQELVLPNLETLLVRKP